MATDELKAEMKENEAMINTAEGALAEKSISLGDSFHTPVSAGPLYGGSVRVISTCFRSEG